MLLECFKFKTVFLEAWLKISINNEKPIAEYKYPFGTSIWNDSIIKLKPIKSKNPKHRITTVGCFETKTAIKPEAHINNAIAIVTAMIMM